MGWELQFSKAVASPCNQLCTIIVILHIRFIYFIIFVFSPVSPWGPTEAILETVRSSEERAVPSHTSDQLVDLIGDLQLDVLD